jgi:NAD(P)-dependent dehydrogenase (short-subunit alcohol dehydrogenase family)
MKTVVITGSTRGIGRGLAESFLQRGCNVVINGRRPESVEQTVMELAKQHPTERIHGFACDVSSLEQLQKLWDAAVGRFDQVDIWINNAGRGHYMHPSWELPTDTIESVIDIDLMGVIYGSRVAMKGMIQQGHGHLYNMEGFGSDGRVRAGMSIYAATKSAVRTFTRTLTKEAAETPVKVSALSPGIVITDFITDQYKDDPQRLEDAKRIFNILGDHVETVTPWLADRVLANEKSGALIAWLTTPKVISRFLAAPLRKRDLFAN